MYEALAQHPGLLKNSTTHTHNNNNNNYNNNSNSSNGNGNGKDRVLASNNIPMNEEQLAELAAKTESDVADIKIIFPSYGSGFIEACLLVTTTHTHTHSNAHTHMYIQKYTEIRV